MNHPDASTMIGARIKWIRESRIERRRMESMELQWLSEALHAAKESGTDIDLSRILNQEASK